MIAGDAKPTGVPIRDMASRRSYVLPGTVACVVVASIARPDDARPDVLRVRSFDAATGVATYLFARGRNYAEEPCTVGATTLGELAPGTLAYVRSHNRAAGCETWWISRIGQAV